MIRTDLPLDPVPLERVYDVATEVWGPTADTFIRRAGRKRCTRCHAEKPLDAFHVARGGGHLAERYPICRVCRSTRYRKRAA